MAQRAGVWHEAFSYGMSVRAVSWIVGATLLIAGFQDLTRRDPGFRSDNLLTFDIGLSQGRYGITEQVAFTDRLLERMRAIPGVQAAATGTPCQGHAKPPGVPPSS